MTSNRHAPAVPLRRAAFMTAACLLTLGCQAIPGQDVRYEPSPLPVVRAMLELADVRPADVVYDLGSGDGRIPITAAREFGARGVGIEIDPKLVERAEENAREAGVADKVEFRLGDMYAADVRSATVVTLFLHPEPNLKLRPKLLSQLEPGSRVVSYVWDMGDWKPERERRINRHRIYLWTIPDRSPDGALLHPIRRRMPFVGGGFVPGRTVVTRTVRIMPVWLWRHSSRSRSGMGKTTGHSARCRQPDRGVRLPPGFLRRPGLARGTRAHGPGPGVLADIASNCFGQERQRLERVLAAGTAPPPALHAEALLGRSRALTVGSATSTSPACIAA